MAERWFATVDAADDLKSLSTTANPDLPPGWGVIDLGIREQPEGVWNKVTHDFDPIPADPDDTASGTVVNTPAVRTKLRAVVQGTEAFTAAERDRVLAFVALRLL